MTRVEDAAVPDLRLERERSIDESTVREVSYLGAGAKRVTALLVLASTPAPHAGVLFLHWGFGDRNSFLAEAIAYAGCGATSLLVDAPGFGARKGPRVPGRDEHAVRGYAEQLLGDLKRGLAALAAQAGVDPERLAFVGHSLGATVAGAFLAGESRVRAAVLLGGHGELSRLWLAKPSAEGSQALEDLDGVRTLGRTRASLLLQFGERDEFIPLEAAERYVAAAPETRVARTYACDHAFAGDGRPLRERAAWLGHELGFAPLAEERLARVALPRAQLWTYRALKPLLALANRFARRAP